MKGPGFRTMLLMFRGGGRGCGRDVAWRHGDVGTIEGGRPIVRTIRGASGELLVCSTVLLRSAATDESEQIASSINRLGNVESVRPVTEAMDVQTVELLSGVNKMVCLHREQLFLRQSDDKGAHRRERKRVWR